MPRGAKGDNKPRGRMSSYAYFVQTCREEHKKKYPEEAIAFAAFSKKCADRWKVMSEHEKKRFVDMAELDKQRYDMEMQSYVPEGGKKRKQKKDPNAPKRALSAFFFFCNDERGAIKSANPEYSVGDIAKQLGRMWGECGEQVKQRYNAMAEKDKERYEQEMVQYRNSQHAASQLAAANQYAAATQYAAASQYAMAGQMMDYHHPQ